MSLLSKLIAAASSPVDNLYVEDVFSTYLYTGTGAAKTITNGIDLVGEGGMVWTKCRSNTVSHGVYDTERGVNKLLDTTATIAEYAATNSVTSFNSDGFTLGADNIYGASNLNGYTYASWTFRKAPKFFDVVTYTGTGSATTIAHGLGVVPGMIIVKRTDTTGDWQVYHRSLTSAAYKLVLNTTSAESSDSTAWNSTAPTSTVFSVGTNATVNASGGTYVAYIYAHNAGGFGADGTEDIISCGSYSGPGTGGGAIELGFEPQYLLIKRSVSADNWHIYDAQRGMIVTASGNAGNAVLRVEGAFGESSLSTFGSVYPTATGFYIAPSSSSSISASGQTFIYMAIRRPMKVPTAGTKVYSAIARTGTGAAATVTGVGFAPDLVTSRKKSAVGSNFWEDRLRGLSFLVTDSSIAEVPYTATITSFDMDGVSLGGDSDFNGSGIAHINHFFKRAPVFMDVVCYTGTGVAHTEAHNLGVVPELLIVKSRSVAANWFVYHKDVGVASALYLNTNGASAGASAWNSTAPTDTVFSLGTGSSVNGSGTTFVAYLMATLAGVSKVGSYTGNATTNPIDCGFSAGARFVLIKRTDSTGDWYLWDTARGIISGNDPYLLLNSTSAEVTGTDYIDPYSAGFEISSSAPAAINASGGTFIFWAIA